VQLHCHIAVALCSLSAVSLWAADVPDLPAAEATTTAEKLNLGPTKLYVQWTGKATDFRFFRVHHSYYVGEDFSFTLTTEKDGIWPVISREPTPFESWRFGTTYTGLDVDWAKNPKVRVVAVKTIDRLPPLFQDYKLDPAKILTALIVEVWSGDHWRPWFINNWFHQWGTPADSALILSHYVGRPSPYFDVYGFRGDISAELNERSHKLVEKHPEWRAYHGRIVADPKAKHGWALDLFHYFVKNNNTGGYDPFGADPKELIPLSRPSPVKMGLGWPSLYHGPNHPNIADAELAPPLKVKWTFTGAKEFPGSPAVADGKVYCGNNDGRLYCIEAASGKKLWDFLTGDLVESTPTIVDGSVVFGSFDGNVYCLDAANGKERWHFRTGLRLAGFTGIDDVKQGVDSSAAVVEGRVYFGAWDGKMYCVDCNNGKELWSQQTRGLTHFCSPAVAGGRVFLGTTDGLFHCWDAKKGTLVWEKKLAGKHSDHMMSSPAVHEGIVYVGSGYDGPLYALEAASGNEVRTFPLKNLVCGTPTVHAGRMYVFGDGGGQVVCFNVQTGAQVWETRLGKGWGSGSPVVAGKYLYLTMRDGRVDGKAAGVIALEVATGKPVWSAPTGKAWGTCAIADGVLYYGSDDGKVYALQRE
jgi:outer membrane protein assembly factor BamB